MCMLRPAVSNDLIRYATCAFYGYYEALICSASVMPVLLVSSVRVMCWGASECRPESLYCCISRKGQVSSSGSKNGRLNRTKLIPSDGRDTTMQVLRHFEGHRHLLWFAANRKPGTTAIRPLMSFSLPLCPPLFCSHTFFLFF